MFFIGTSGWHYRHWRGPFYPEKLPASEMLPFYAERFATVELNTTFYRLPPPKAPADWRRRTPGGFCFAAKGSRFITHMKKLREPAPALERYFERIRGLGNKLGPIVFQLPPQQCRAENVRHALDAVTGARIAFDPHAQRAQLLRPRPDRRAPHTHFPGDLLSADHDHRVIGEQRQQSVHPPVGGAG